jgi:hypothetical protein
MKATLRLGVLAFALGVGLVAAAAADSKVRVNSSRGLQLAIVDSSRASPPREALHEAFALSLAKAIGDSCGTAMPVHAKWVSADKAAFGLSNGTYEAVLVIGSSLPRPLMISDVTRLNATVLIGQSQKNVYFIFNSSDEGLQKHMTASFPNALGDPRFLNVLDPDAIPAGTKVADSGR